jgi:hypothetical protein
MFLSVMFRSLIICMELRLWIRRKKMAAYRDSLTQNMLCFYWYRWKAKHFLHLFLVFMSNFRLKDVLRWSQNSYLIMLLYRRKTYFTAICILLKNSRHFLTKYSIFCWIAKKNLPLQGTTFAELLNKILPVQIRAQTRYHVWASFNHGGLFLLTQDTNAEHILTKNSTSKRRN